MVTNEPIWVDEPALRDTLPMGAAIEVLEEALRAGLDPEADHPRAAVELPAGQLLLMPAGGPTYVGVKVVSVAPGNQALSLPRIQGVYLLLDAATLTPRAVLDGAGLTALRTPATSAVAVRWLATPGTSRLVLFGTGPQAWGHLAAVRLVRPVTQVTVVGRDSARLARFVARCAASGIPARAGTPDAVADADLVVCATTSREPLFAPELLPRHATVVAVGSHEPDAREIAEQVVLASTVIVEARDAALREAGELAGQEPGRIAGNLAELVRGELTVDLSRPRLYKSVGMAWQDLVVAAAAYERLTGR